MDQEVLTALGYGVMLALGLLVRTRLKLHLHGRKYFHGTENLLRIACAEHQFIDKSIECACSLR